MHVRAADTHALAATLRDDAALCASLDSPLSAHILERAAGDADAGGPVRDVLGGPGAPVPALVGLRLLGALHRLALTGAAPDLAARYPTTGGDGDPPGAWRAARRALTTRGREIAVLCRRPVQTNEPARSAALAGGFLTVAEETGLPLRVLEAGASAGLNLRWDRFRFDDAGGWGDPASPVRLSGLIVSGTPPFGVTTRVVERAGCDRSPVDPLTREGRLTLRSFVWADHPERLAVLDAAIAVAATVPAHVERAALADWLPRVLAEPAEGAATVVVHTAVWHYLTDADRAALTAALTAAAARATPGAPLAWLRLEPAGREPMELRLTSWPGGAERLLATSTGHGRRVVWL